MSNDIKKTKKCKICGKEFEPSMTTQKVCSMNCAIKYGKSKVEKENQKEERKQLKEAKERIKTRQQHLNEAQRIFNKYIRLRDKDEPCISCRRFHQGQYHAGHYRSVGAHPELRFDENNNHKQCSSCNNNLSGNLIQYRIGLIEKIGLEAVEKLESKNDPKNYTIEEIKEIKEMYRKKIKAIEEVSKL